jgi:hypothetical protein
MTSATDAMLVIRPRLFVLSFIHQLFSTIIARLSGAVARVSIWQSSKRTLASAYKETPMDINAIDFEASKAARNVTDASSREIYRELLTFERQAYGERNVIGTSQIEREAGDPKQYNIPAMKPQRWSRAVIGCEQNLVWDSDSGRYLYSEDIF